MFSCLKRTTTPREVSGICHDQERDGPLRATLLGMASCSLLAHSAVVDSRRERQQTNDASSRIAEALALHSDTMIGLWDEA